MAQAMTSGRCRTCKMAYTWPASPKTLLRLMRCPKCRGGLAQTTHRLKSVPMRQLTRDEALAAAITEAKYREQLVNWHIASLKAGHKAGESWLSPLTVWAVEDGGYAVAYSEPLGATGPVGETDSLAEWVRRFLVPAGKAWNKALPKAQRVEVD